VPWRCAGVELGVREWRLGTARSSARCWRARSANAATVNAAADSVDVSRCRSNGGLGVCEWRLGSPRSSAGGE
jgi:hypothetical protein